MIVILRPHELILGNYKKHKFFSLVSAQLTDPGDNFPDWPQKLGRTDILAGQISIVRTIRWVGVKGHKIDNKITSKDQ